MLRELPVGADSISARKTARNICRGEHCSPARKAVQTMMQITLLGTGGTQPLPDRALAAMAVTVQGRTLLLDCGEGTQVSLRRYGVSAYRIEAVLLTHYHGDHILGLPGLLQTLASLNRTAPLTIYGPPGQEGLAAAISLLTGPLPPLPLPG